MGLPTLKLKAREDRRLRAGHAWIFSNEVDVRATALKDFEPGTLVRVESSSGRALGLAYVNPAALICARMLSRDTRAAIDESWLQAKLRKALALRARLFETPFYRAVFGESDGLPGLVVDRFDDVLAIQLNTAGMEALRVPLLSALQAVFAPRVIVLRNDSPMRELEGLGQVVEVLGPHPGEVELHEGPALFAVEPAHGQKTGWYFDQRDNRLRLARYVRDARVLDAFSYVGAWGIQAALAGAREVTCVDGSASALERARANAARNGVALLHTQQGEVLEVLKTLSRQGERFDVVVLDPPALIKRRKDLPQGAEHYARLSRAAMQLLGDDGFLVSASCSYHMSGDHLQRLLNREARALALDLQVLERHGQAVDHPVHPAIAETAYLKVFFCRVAKS